MKSVLMVRHADGTKERICPKCNQVMTLHEGGYIDRFAQGEHYQVEYPDSWICESCGFEVDEREEKELALAFGAV